MSLPMQQGILPLEYLIAGPLEALVKAQTLSARTTAEFVGEVGFETDEKGVSRVRMVDFEYTHPRVDPDNPGNVIDTPVRVRVPLLSLLQVPSIAVEEANLELNLRVMGQQPVQRPQLETRSATTARQGTTALPIEMAPSPVRMIGSLTTPKLAEQTASMKVAIKLKQAPVPEGLSQILHLLGEATTARPAGDR